MNLQNSNIRGFSDKNNKKIYTLCREKNDEVVEYALSRSLSPKKILQDKMNELYERFDK